MRSDLASAIADVRAGGRPRDVLCPAHDDRRKSLSVGLGEGGRVLLDCKAGCSFAAVVQAAGIDPASLRGQSRSARRIVATYPYVDERGAVLYEVVRFDPKDFLQRRPDGRGGWIWNVDGVRRVVFGLPELRGQKFAYLVEGERDALTLRAAGVTATTNAGGASKNPDRPKWRREYTEQLVDAGIEGVAILPDNDAAGRAHAEAVARSCSAAGLRVKVVSLPGEKDVTDWLGAGHTVDELRALVAAAPLYGNANIPKPAPVCSIRLTAASAIKVRPVRWLWQDRIALGSLALLGGREGVGKTLCAYTLAADITRGRLAGAYLGMPRAVVVAATEDSWEHTIVPRLMAADADLDRVYRVAAVAVVGVDATLSLPRDLIALERVAREVQAALVILDPLLSRLDTALDTHKDAEVRVALEPLVKLAAAADASVLGLIHVNKSKSSDVLTLLMGSRAFAAVARAVLFVWTDPDDESLRLLAQAKNNLGRMDLPTLSFRIVGAHVADTDEGPVWTGKLEWRGETDRSINDAVESATGTLTDRTATSDAVEWLQDFLGGHGGRCESATIKDAARRAGHSIDAVKRARRQLRIVSATVRESFPRRTEWSLPSQSGQAPGDIHPTAPTTPTTPSIDAVGAVGAVGAVENVSPRAREERRF